MIVKHCSRYSGTDKCTQWLVQSFCWKPNCIITTGWDQAKGIQMNQNNWGFAVSKYLPLTCGDRLNLVQHSRYHGCWCPASLCCQDISTNDIDYVEQASSCLTWGIISTSCVMSMWRNDIKCKYMFLFPLKKLARKGLITALWTTILPIISDSSNENPSMSVRTSRNYYILVLYA